MALRTVKMVQRTRKETLLSRMIVSRDVVEHRTSVPWAVGVFSRNGDPFMVTTQYSFSGMENLNIHEEITFCKPLMSFRMNNVAKEFLHCTQKTFIFATIE